MVGCTCTRTYVIPLAGRTRTRVSIVCVASVRCVCIVCVCGVRARVCVCAYVKIIHNGILHNGLCPSRSWKEMKNEALLSAGSFSLYMRACARVCPSNVLSYTYLFPPVQPFPYLSVLQHCYAASREYGMW